MHTVTLESGNIEITATAENDRVRFTVADGRGPAQYLDITAAQAKLLATALPALFAALAFTGDE